MFVLPLLAHKYTQLKYGKALFYGRANYKNQISSSSRTPWGNELQGGTHKHTPKHTDRNVFTSQVVWVKWKMNLQRSIKSAPVSFKQKWRKSTENTHDDADFFIFISSVSLPSSRTAHLRLTDSQGWAQEVEVVVLEVSEMIPTLNWLPNGCTCPTSPSASETLTYDRCLGFVHWNRFYFIFFLSAIWNIPSCAWNNVPSNDLVL